LQYKHPRSIKRVIRSGKSVTLILLFWSHKCDFGAEPRSRIIATWAVKGLTTKKTHTFTILAKRAWGGGGGRRKEKYVRAKVNCRKCRGNE
jgi:hypothetical protein